MESKNKKMKRVRRARAPLGVDTRVVSVSSRKGAVAGNALNSLTPLQRQIRLTAPTTPVMRPPMISFPVAQPIITPQGGVIQPTAIQALEQSIAQLSRGLNLTSNLLFNPPQQNFTPVAPRIQAQALNATPQGVAQPYDQAKISQLNIAGGSSSMLNLQAPIGALQAQAVATNTPRPQTQSLPVIGYTTARSQNIQPLPSITAAQAQPTATPANVIQLSTADNPEFINEGGMVSVQEPAPSPSQVGVQRPPITDAEIEDYLKLENQGKSVRQIAEAMNTTERRVHNIKNKAGTKLLDMAQQAQQRSRLK